MRSQGKSSPEQMKRKRLEIQKDINRRNEMANKRQRSIEGLKRRVPFYETKTREVSVKELQAEKRAIEQGTQCDSYWRDIDSRAREVSTAPFTMGKRKEEDAEEPSAGSIEFVKGANPWRYAARVESAVAKRSGHHRTSTQGGGGHTDTTKSREGA